MAKLLWLSLMTLLLLVHGKEANANSFGNQNFQEGSDNPGVTDERLLSACEGKNVNIKCLLFANEISEGEDESDGESVKNPQKYLPIKPEEYRIPKGLDDQSVDTIHSSYLQRKKRSLGEVFAKREPKIYSFWDFWRGRLGKEIKRPNFSPWGGKRSENVKEWNPMYQAVSTKGGAFRSWGGKRSTFRSWGGKRVPFKSWGGKRNAMDEEPLYHWEEVTPYHKLENKREPLKFRSWGGKRNVEENWKNDENNEETILQILPHSGDAVNPQPQPENQEFIEIGNKGEEHRDKRFTKFKDERYQDKQSQDRLKLHSRFHSWGGKRNEENSIKIVN